LTYNNLDFLSRDCKQDKHHECIGKWYGLGFEVICKCKCGHDKKEMALELFEATNATKKILSSSRRLSIDYG
jgi:hypothetical protein